MKLIALIVGSALGGTARYGVSLAATSPYGTLFVNLLGCLLSGQKGPTGAAHLLLIIGFCGSFTTFSTFALEILQLLDSSHFFKAASIITVSVIIGLAFVRAGAGLSRVLFYQQ